jgi:hypothetical protein
MSMQGQILHATKLAGCGVVYLILGIIICATLPLWITKDEINKQMGSEDYGETFR